MSRIGKLPISVPSGVEVTIEGQKVKVKGPKGELSLEVKPVIKVTLKDATIEVTRKNDAGQTRAYHGLFRSLIANMVEGVSKGFTKELEMSGVGYKAKGQGKKLLLSVGYSHQVEFDIPESIDCQVPDERKIIISGIDKELVGEISAKIRAIKPCEPYKGKGIKYVGEVIRRKAGKAAKAAE